MTVERRTTVTGSDRDSWSLAGEWQFRSVEAGDDAWRPVRVPGIWEESGVPKDRPGPFLYRRTLDVPADLSGRRLWLTFDAVSYACRLLIDGREVGRHVGAWDRFSTEITEAVRPGGRVDLVIEVEKPASPIAGPDSPVVPGRYPLRETLSGFLPYVWGHMFGGIWQDVRLEATGRTVIEDANVLGDPRGRATVEVDLSDVASLDVEIEEPAGRVVARERTEPRIHHRIDLTLPGPRAWSPAHPQRYVARIRVADGDARSIPFGLRRVQADGAAIRLNGDIVFPRMVLSWGWYPNGLRPSPEPERVRSDLLELRKLGFNGVKLCLWFPPEHYFRIADELGMLLWVELPMWLPRPTPAFIAQVGPEYERLVRQARRHPSVILLTLGCELDASTAELIEPLFRRVKALAGDMLVRDNSGSGEAYGGRLDELADFYDHHPYADLPYLRQMLEHFAPGWRLTQPWLLGEFADSDAFRDPRRAARSTHDVPWWASPDEKVNPQGARWTMEASTIANELDRSGDAARGPELRRISEQSALLERRYAFETARSFREISGYVVTGERDTPISTAGIWDDEGRLRLGADEFRSSNADLVVVLGSERRRAWIAGGDRPAPLDRWNHRSGDRVRLHLIAAHHGQARGPASVAWSVSWTGAGMDVSSPFAKGRVERGPTLVPGDVREITIARFVAPDVDAPAEVRLDANVTIGEEVATNAWPLWLFPGEPLRDVGQVGLIDPDGLLDDLRPLLGDRLVPVGEAGCAVATAWTPEAAELVDAGGGLVLLQPGRHGLLPAVPLPFWREAIRVAEPHAAWGDFPVDPFVGLQLFAASADHAFEPLQRAGRRPILRRVDARNGRTHDYAVELPWGRGRLIATTLRLAGGGGELPLRISASAASLHLLGCWLRYLSET